MIAFGGWGVQVRWTETSRGFVNMWRNFLLFVAAGIEALGVVIPVAVILAAAVAGWKRWRRRRMTATA